MKKIEELKWKRLLDVSCLPYHLVDALDKDNYTSEEFYDYIRQELWDKEIKGRPNKYSQLWVLIKEKENIPRGFCWIKFNVLKKVLEVEALSIEEEYRKGGKSITKLKELLEKLLEEENISKSVWATKSRDIAQKHGFIRSKKEVMEYNRIKEGEEK